MAGNVPTVMAGLDPAISSSTVRRQMAGSSPAMMTARPAMTMERPAVTTPCLGRFDNGY